MDGTIFTGKTVDEAIEIGLDQLGIAKQEAVIEVLNEGRKGIFHIGTKPAEVRITKKGMLTETESSQVVEEIAVSAIDTISTITTNEEEASRKGKAWVENGGIFCIDPEEGDLIVHIPPSVLFYKNNELVQDHVTISEKDEIRVEIHNKEHPTKWLIETNSTLTEAVIKIDPGYKLVYSLKDHKPNREITLDVRESKIPNLTLTIEEVQEKLKSLGIVYGILEEQINAACQATKKSTFIIAAGDLPIEGKNGWLEFKVEVNEGKRFKEREDGSIDFREGSDIPAVGAGVEIAVHHDPIEGQAGKSLKGVSISPKPVKELQVKLGQGAKFKENDERTIISMIVGRPSIVKKGLLVVIDVVPKLEHQGDVNLASGNIKFNGDILVSGGVDESMSIIASGNIEIKGTTSNATVKAGQSIHHYSNVISSDLVAGNSNKMLIEKVKELSEILEKLETMQTDLRQISQNPSFSQIDLKTGIMSLVKVLIQTKYSGFIDMLRQFIISNKNNSELEILGEEWQLILTKLHNSFIMMDPKGVKSLDDFDELVYRIKYFIDISDVTPDMSSSIILPSAMSSEISSSGDVVITKQGCYNTNIYAQGTVKVHGFIRGGTVFAGNGAEIEEIGSKGGAPTLVIVPEDQTIKIKSALTDSTIQIGKKKHTFSKDMTHIVARLDETGTILLH